MPAINLARLKTQAVRLSEKFSEPESFVRDLNELLDFYTNRTIRATQISTRFSIPSFRTPPPVLRQIQGELEPLAESHPDQAIVLAIALWKAGSVESRLLAAFLLGTIPPGLAMPALSRLPDWLSQSTDSQILTALLNDALARLRRENTDAFFILLEEWLKSPRNNLHNWGMRALIPVLINPDFENLPAVFRILKPAVRAAGPATQLELQACLAALERISLTETLAFMREVIADNPDPIMLRTFRRILGGLSPGMQSGMREILREQERQP